MKTILASVLILGSLSLYARNCYLFECHGKAVEAAKAVDEVNFKSFDRSSVAISNRSQKKTFAKIEVTVDSLSIYYL